MKDPKKDIKLFINSPGGSLSDTIAIYDVVQLVRADVLTIALGIAASTASIILGAGSKGKQLMQNIAELVPRHPERVKKQESQKAKKQEPQAPTATSGTSSKSGKGGKKKR